MTLRGGGGGGEGQGVIMTLTVGNMICESPLSILLLVSVLSFFCGLFSTHSKAKANYKGSNLRKIGN